MKPWLRAAVSLALFAAIFLFVPWHEVQSAWGRVSGGVWALAVAGFIAGHLIGVVKWRMLVQASGGLLRLADATVCYAAGLFANLCLPTLVGGDVLRAALAGTRMRQPQAAVWGSVIDRINDLLATAILVAGGLVVSQQSLPGVWRGLAILSAGLMAAVVLALALPYALRIPFSRWPRPLRRPVARMFVTLRRSARNPRAMLAGFGLSLAIQGMFTLIAAGLGRSIGIDIGLSAWFLAWPLAKIAGLMPVSLGGLAVREAALASLLVPFGVPFADGVVASLLWQTVLIAGGLAAGAYWWLAARRAGERASLHPVAAPSSIGTE
jgi:hypothetical protein